MTRPIDEIEHELRQVEARLRILRKEYQEALDAVDARRAAFLAGVAQGRKEGDQ